MVRTSGFSCPRGRRLLVLFLTAGLLAATAHADLPSSVASRVKRIETALVAVEKAIEADRLTTAERKLKEANRHLEEIQGRYGGKFDENDPTYVAMTEHLAAVTALVETARTADAQAKDAGNEATAANEALCSQWVAKLGPFVDRKSEQYLPIGAELNRRTPEGQARAKSAYVRAKALFAEFQAISFPLRKTPELSGIESRLASSLKYYDGLDAKAAREAACKDWVDQLAPYVDVGMNSPKRLIAASTVDSRQIAEQQLLYEEATAVFAIYQKADFPLGKTPRLEQLELAMATALEEFPAAMAQSHAMISGDIDARLDRVLQYLSRDTGWTGDTSKKPPIIMERDLASLRQAVAEYAKNVESSDAKLVELRARLERIEDENAQHKVIRAERTYQYQDAYRGSDLATLKKQAEIVAEKAHKGGRVSHVTLPSDDWVIENVIEFTDTTRTAIRRRITRSVRAQVCVKSADGQVWLQEVYLGQDRLPDGTWAKLKGHTTWADPMAEANIGKLVPPAESRS